LGLCGRIRTALVAAEVAFGRIAAPHVGGWATMSKVPPKNLLPLFRVEFSTIALLAGDRVRLLLGVRDVCGVRGLGCVRVRLSRETAAARTKRHFEDSMPGSGDHPVCLESLEPASSIAPQGDPKHGRRRQRHVPRGRYRGSASQGDTFRRGGWPNSSAEVNFAKLPRPGSEGARAFGRSGPIAKPRDGRPRGRRRAPLNLVAAPALRCVRRQRRSASQPAFTTPRSGLRIT
jgi:hypothetical protein